MPVHAAVEAEIAEIGVHATRSRELSQSTAIGTPSGFFFLFFVPTVRFLREVLLPGLAAARGLESTGP